MRPLVHPPAEAMTVEGILYALSDPVRVRLYMEVLYSECAKSCSVLAAVEPVPLPKSTLSHHFKILREAGLIFSERKGVELQNRSRWDEYEKKFGPMVQEIIKAYGAEFKTARARPKSVRSRSAA